MQDQAEKMSAEEKAYYKEIGFEVAQTILRQLGGNKFCVMTGAKNFVYSGITDDNPHNWLRMNIGRNAGKVNRLKITLVGDEYRMYFYYGRMVKGEYKISNEHTSEGVYCDQLQEIFTNVTGMYTRL